MPERLVAGRSIVTRRAIVDIVRTAVQSSYGVMGFSDPSLGRRLLRWIGLDRPGIKVATEGGLALDVYITVASGVPVAEVARQVDSAVRYSVRHLIGVDVASLRIHVDGLGYQPTAHRMEALEPEPAEPAKPQAGPGSARRRAGPGPARRRAGAGPANIEGAKAPAAKPRASRGTASRRRKPE
jgi:uncharacterized alkaline shock family protein YloU